MTISRARRDRGVSRGCRLSVACFDAVSAGAAGVARGGRAVALSVVARTAAALSCRAPRRGASSTRTAAA